MNTGSGPGTRVGRHVTSRIRARGWLRTESPLHVGGLARDPSEPLPIALDGLGRLHVPGTTLAGVLRSWSRGIDTDPGALGEFWGFTQWGGDGGRASRVIVADALITAEPRLNDRGLPAVPLDPDRLEFRHSVGIDRVTGTAAQEFLYGRAVVPAGCYLRMEIDVESHLDGAVDEARMGSLLAALSAGEVRIGAATGRGLGAVRLLDDPFELLVDRFDSRAGLLAVLRGDPARGRSVASLCSADPEFPPRRDLLDVRVVWRPRAPVMVRAASGGLVVDTSPSATQADRHHVTLPLTTRVDRHHVTLTVPGGSIKGALRAHAELVEHTARGSFAPEAPSAEPGASAAEHSAAFRARLDRLRAVGALFGSAPGAGDRRAGALRAEECTALVTVPDELWGLVTGTEAHPQDGTGQAVAAREVEEIGVAEGGEAESEEEPGRALADSVRDRLEDLGMARADHVALDRWTGGAAPGRLFGVLEPHGVEWEPIRLSVDLTRLGDERDSALALLLLTLRDLAAGRILLGALVNRGFGDVDVTEITLTGGPWPGQVTLSRALEGPETAPIAQAWTDYLAQEVA